MIGGKQLAAVALGETDQLFMLASVWSRVRPASRLNAGHHVRWETASMQGFPGPNKAGTHTLGLALPSRTLSQAPAAEDCEVVAPRNVLEDASNDYVSVQENFKPLPPTVMELIQTKLPQFLPKPNPHDASVFENAMTEEYADILAPECELIAPSSVSESLRSLVGARNFDEAYHVLQEILTSDIRVRPSFIYLSAAYAALLPSPTAVSLEEQTKKCLDWLSLLPTADPANPTHFGLLRKLLFESTFSNITTATAVSVALTKKGYGNAISGHAIPFVFRHASPDLSMAFISELEDAARDFWAREHPTASQSHVNGFKTKVRSAAIKTLAHSRRSEQAAQLLPTPSKPSFKLTAPTYDALLFALKRDKPSAVDLYAAIQHLRSLDSTCFRSSPQEKDYDPDVLKPLTRFIHPASDSYIGPKAASRLQMILDSLRQDKLPRLSNITDFLHYAARLERSDILSTLHETVKTTHPTHATHIFLAEMLFYHQRGQHLAVIDFFCENYYCTEIPPDAVSRHSSSAQVVSNPIPTPPSRERNGDDYLYRPRLWPSHAHTDLVWQALVQLSPSLQETAQLYETFLKIVNKRGSDVDPFTGNPIVYLRAPPSFSRIVDTEAFTAFMARLGTTPERCSTIFNDMVQARIIPSIHNFTQLAGMYARHGQTSQAFFIVDMLEKHHSLPPPTGPKTRELALEESLLAEDGGSVGSSTVAFTRDPKDKLPRPDLAFYTCIMTMFLKAGNISAAVEISDRLSKRFIYYEGRHPPLDMAYEKMEQLKQLQKKRASRLRQYS